MKDRNRNLLTGLFVLAGLICLGTLIVLFGETRTFFGKRYEIKARFDRITGVREGTDVNLAGVWVGSVGRIELANPLDPREGVYAVLEIDPKYSVPKGAVAVVVSPLMGQSVINIMPPLGASFPLEQDGEAEIRGEIKNPLETIVDPRLMDVLQKTTEQIGTLAEAMTPAATALEGLLQKRPVEEVDATANTPDAVVANLSTTIERLHNVLKHIETVLGDPEVKSNLKETLANFRTASESAKAAVEGFKIFSEEAQNTAVTARRTMEKAEATVDTTHAHIDTLGKSLILSADKMARLLDYGVSAGRDLAEGEGTMGLLLRDPKFYDELMLTVQRLGAAASELQVLIQQWQKQGLLGAAK